MKQNPDSTEFEFGFMAFLIAVPLAVAMVRWLSAWTAG
jgi:predicted PurR-regulated permease PerM